MRNEVPLLWDDGGAKACDRAGRKSAADVFILIVRTERRVKKKNVNGVLAITEAGDFF